MNVSCYEFSPRKFISLLICFSSIFITANFQRRKFSHHEFCSPKIFLTSKFEPANFSHYELFIPRLFLTANFQHRESSIKFFTTRALKPTNFTRVFILYPANFYPPNALIKIYFPANFCSHEFSHCNAFSSQIFRPKSVLARIFHYTNYSHRKLCTPWNYLLCILYPANFFITIFSWNFPVYFYPTIVIEELFLHVLSHFDVLLTWP